MLVMHKTHWRVISLGFDDVVFNHILSIALFLSSFVFIMSVIAD